MIPLDPPLARNRRLRETLCGPQAAGATQEHVADLVDDLSEAENPEDQIRIARLLLVYDPENIDAYLALAEHAGSYAESIALLRDAVRIGLATWKPALDGERDVEWWGTPGTRPFMRAIKMYGDALAETGHPEEAAKCFKALLKLQPGDSLGAGAALEKLSEAGHRPGPRR